MTRKIGFALVPLLLFVLMAEIGLRAADPQAGPVFLLRDGIQWALPANLNAASYRIAESGRVFSASTDGQGLRRPPDSHVPEEGASATKTVLVLGDSVIFGWGVEDYQTMPHAMEQAWTERFPQAPIRVLNGGIPGYSSLQSLYLFRETRLFEQVDLVLLEVTRHNWTATDTPDAARLSVAPRDRLDQKLMAHSRIFRALRRARGLTDDRYQDLRLSTFSEAGFVRPYRDEDTHRVSPAELYEVLLDLATLGQAHDFRVGAWLPIQTERQRVPALYAQSMAEAHQQGLMTSLPVSECFTAQGGLGSVHWLADNPGHYAHFGAWLAGTCAASAVAEADLL